MAGTLKRLPLHERHVRAGAHLGAFGDWEVPLYFTSILEEHESVRLRSASPAFLIGAGRLNLLKEARNRAKRQKLIFGREGGNFTIN